MLKTSLETVEKGLTLFQSAVATIDKYTFGVLTVFLFVVIYTLHVRSLELNEQVLELNHDIKEITYKCDSDRIANYKVLYTTLNKIETERDSLKYLVKFLTKK